MHGDSDKYGLKGKSSITIYLIGYLLMLLLLGLIALQIGTQYIAYKLNYQRALGDFWLQYKNIPIYPFWNIFTWRFSNIAEVKIQGYKYAFFAFIMPQLVIYACSLWFRNPKGNKKLHGSAKWAIKKEIEKMGLLSCEGVYIGGWQKNPNSEILYLRHNGPEHCMGIAPTRSGKGVGLILTTLLSWLGSAIVLDIKGENWALTSGYRKSMGHKVLRFDPTDPSGSACKFNPLEEIRLDTYFAVQDVQNMALMIVDPDGKGLHDHWTKAAFAFFSGIILHCCIMIKVNKKRTATLQDLALMMSGFEQSIGDLLNEMSDISHVELLKELYPTIDEQIGHEAHAFIASSANEMKAKADAEASGVISSALVNMALYRDPIVNINTSSSDFRIADLMNHDDPVDLYLVLSPASIDRCRPLIRLITDLIVRRLCRDMAFKDGSSVKGYKHRMLLMFDEFTSLGKLPIIEKSIAYSAGYGVKMFLIVQDITQLNAVYGKDNALMANCHVRIAYAPNTIETAKVLSEMTGKTTVVDRKTSVSYSKGGRSTSESISETARPLLTPDECMRLPSAEKDVHGNVIRAGHMLIFIAGQSPIYGVQLLYFKDPVFLERAKIPPPQVSEQYPHGVSDSLYRKDEIIEATAIPLEIEKAETTINLEDYLVK